MKTLVGAKGENGAKVKICAHSESFVGADAQDADQAAKGVENGMKMPGPLANRGLRRLSKARTTAESPRCKRHASRDVTLAAVFDETVRKDG